MGRILDKLQLGDVEFQRIRRLMLTHAGIALSETKRAMVCRRLSSRLRALGIDCFKEYLSVLQADKDELGLCVNAVTTNLTYFFREPHHFDFLKQLLISLPAQQRVRIWSAGCSTGEEPYSIAMIAGEAGVLGRVTIEATDINSEALEVARAGVYPADSLSGLSQLRLKRWFLKGTGARLGLVKVRDELRSAVRFQHFNLQSEKLLEGLFTVIFCRNVTIYFERSLQMQLFEKFAPKFEAGGYLLIGHSESLLGMGDLYRSCGRCIYQKRMLGHS